MRIRTCCERNKMRSVIKTPKPTLLCCRKSVVQQLDESTQTLSSVIEFKTVDRREEMKPYKVSDFAISNLLAIGADLNPTVLRGSQHFSISSLEKTLASIPVDEATE